MTYFKDTKTLTACFFATFFFFISNCFATDIFIGQGPQSESFAKKLGIDQKVFYPSATDLFAYHAQVDAESMQTVSVEEAKKIHDQISSLIVGFAAHEPDAIHLHLDHKHIDAGKFNALYDELQEIARKLDLTVNAREDSNASPSQYPPIQRTSVLEIMLAEPEVMATFINHAINAYHQYLASEQLSPTDSCLFVHPQYTPDENNPAEQYIYHYHSDIMLSNPASCAVSHNYAINLRDRLLNDANAKHTPPLSGNSSL